jgi:hypothetical protein
MILGATERFIDIAGAFHRSRDRQTREELMLYEAPDDAFAQRMKSGRRYE